MKKNRCALLPPLGILVVVGCCLFSARADLDPPEEPLPRDLHVDDLAQRAFELVAHQVREATTQSGKGWASQPGAIRTFRDDGSTSRLYKLYSAPDLLAGSTSEALADLPVAWDQSPARFVDLNQPVMVNGELEFPIVDPRSDAEGFAFQETINGVDQTSLPMPVQWIYLLQDGSRGYLDGANRFIGAADPSPDNPIVGRIAFWADDNTCKININTASEGVHWDMPRTDTVEDRGLANSQPTAGEYQRHPGHPAMVCLSSVLFPGRRIGTPEGGHGQMTDLAITDAQLLWRIGNGTGPGGSKAGTRPMTESLTARAEPNDYTPYRSLDEMLTRSSSDDPALANRVARGKFFLTTDSSAPELTAHGYPRVSVWPIDSRNPSPPSDFDQMAGVYRFERRVGASRHSDFYSGAENVRVLNFLKILTARPVPGFGANTLAGKYGTGSFSDRDQILASVYSHIRSTNLGNLSDRAAVFSPSGQVTPICLCGGTSPHRYRFSRSDYPDPLGGGRMFTVSEVALVFHCTGWRDEAGNGAGVNWDNIDLGTKRIAVGVAVEAFCPAHGFAFMAPEVAVKFSNFNSAVRPIYINSQPLEFQHASNLVADPSPTPGGHGGADLFLTSTDSAAMAWIGDVNVPIADTQMSFSTNENPIQLLVCDSDAPASLNNALQSIRLRFPDTNVPVPGIPEAIRDWSTRLSNVANGGSLIEATDTVRSITVSHGDYRLVACTRAVKENVFQPHPDYGDAAKQFAHSLLLADGSAVRGASFQPLIPEVSLPEELVTDLALAPDDPNFAPNLVVAPGAPSAVDPAVTGDFDNGFGNTRDGPYLNAPNDVGIHNGDGLSYFGDPEAIPNLTHNFYAEHRISTGPGMFGSIPSGVRSGAPWRTLLFRPDPQHFGAYSTPDHLWLDLFRMPTPLPYRNGNARPGQDDWKGDAFSSDGKINLNYQILPFAHVQRSTALRAVLKSEKMMAIPNSAGSEYKSPGGRHSYRHFIDPTETLRQWENKFASGQIFRSASEICEQYLVPEGAVLGGAVDGDYPQMRSFWDSQKLTGDNTKERPYTALYQHLTTRSNSYEVHVLAQTITKSKTSPADVLDLEKDAIGEEYRGVGTLMRSIVPDGQTAPNYLADPFADSLNEHFDIEILKVSPTLSVGFEITSITLSPIRHPTVAWQSSIGDSYIIQRSQDLRDWVDVSTVVSQGDSTSYTDNSKPNVARLYYRIVRQ